MATIKLSDQPPVNLAPDTVAEDVQQNMAMIFGTVRGTVPYMREFGVDAGFIDMKMNADINDIVDDAYEQTEKYEQRAQLSNVDLGDMEATGALDVTISYEVAGEETEQEEDEEE